MHRILPPAAALAALVSTPALAAEPPPGSSVAWDIVAGLTTEVGQRLAGSEAEARARDWAKARLIALGFTDVTIEQFTMRGYVRGTDTAALITPVPQKLAITALGTSAPTSAAGITGDIVYFHTLDALKAAPEGSLKGKIVFIDHAMMANQDGSGYGPYGDVRRQGPAIASTKGAMAVVIRSAGTDNHRNPHTGATDFGEAKPIPAGAVSNPDADLIARTAASGKPMRLTLTLTSHPQDGLPSGNVVAELPGRDPKLPAILIGCHLDSWDLATGAIDDGAGCAIVTRRCAAGKGRWQDPAHDPGAVGGQRGAGRLRRRGLRQGSRGRSAGAGDGKRFGRRPGVERQVQAGAGEPAAAGADHRRAQPDGDRLQQG